MLRMIPRKSGILLKDEVFLGLLVFQVTVHDNKPLVSPGTYIVLLMLKGSQVQSAFFQHSN